jgi:hypothetical protein
MANSELFEQVPDQSILSGVQAENDHLFTSGQ